MDMPDLRRQVAEKSRTLSGLRDGKRTNLCATGVVFFLILVGLGLRLARLSFQPLWWDEGYSVWFATHPLARMAALTAQDIHPPLYYALLHGWAALLGASPTALRLLSVIVGVLTIPLLYSGSAPDALRTRGAPGYISADDQPAARLLQPGSTDVRAGRVAKCRDSGCGLAYV